MSLSLVQSRALLGLAAARVTVEVHMANGLPCFTLVGLADTEVKEARERVRCAIQNSGFTFPHNKRITVNLAPADLPKDSGGLDLPIALGILAASAQIDARQLPHYEFSGELSLSGALRPVRGALSMALAAQCCDPQPQLVLPPGSAQEAALVPGSVVFRADHLRDVAAFFALPSAGSPADDRAPCTSNMATGNAPGWVRMAHAQPQRQAGGPDMADVKGQAGARRVLEIAAAGGHNLLLCGPPGSGKSMMAHRFAGLLPDMSQAQALQSASIRSLCGNFDLRDWGVRPTCAPHHTASAVALVGGGSPPRPGEISQAHHGVLFLDELPEFQRAALEALREPLETGAITIVRATRRAEFPARFQLIAAMNPCPCGYLGCVMPACRCTPEQITRYQSRLSGPLLDRIDLHVEVPAVPVSELLQATAGESSATIRQRCAIARERAMARQGTSNHALDGQDIDTHAQPDAAATALLHAAASRLYWSARATRRTLKIARTIADLDASTTICASHVAEALQYRRTPGGGVTAR